MVAYQQLNIAIPPGLWKRLEEYVRESGTSKRAFIIGALTEALDAADDEDAHLNDDDDQQDSLTRYRPQYITVAEAARQAQEAASKPEVATPPQPVGRLAMQRARWRGISF